MGTALLVIIFGYIIYCYFDATKGDLVKVRKEPRIYADVANVALKIDHRVNQLPVIYRSLRKLTTPTEQSFFNQLKPMVSDDHYVSSKVRLADLVEPINHKNRMMWFKKVAMKHVDFVICYSADSTIVACIELDDSSHSSKSALKRDAEKNNALGDAAIPLYRIKVSDDYCAVITKMLSELNILKVTDYDSSRSQLACPVCDGDLSFIPMEGFNKDKFFYNCSFCTYRTKPVKHHQRSNNDI